jgi:hypothetical protein
VRDSGDFALSRQRRDVGARAAERRRPAGQSTQFESLRDALRAVADAERNVVVIPSNTFFLRSGAQPGLLDSRRGAARHDRWRSVWTTDFASAISGIDVRVLLRHAALASACRTWRAGRSIRRRNT